MAIDVPLTKTIFQFVHIFIRQKVLIVYGRINIPILFWNNKSTNIFDLLIILYYYLCFSTFIWKT